MKWCELYNATLRRTIDASYASDRPHSAAANPLASATPATFDDSYAHASGSVSEGWGSVHNEPYDLPIEMATDEEPENAMFVEGEDDNVVLDHMADNLTQAARATTQDGGSAKEADAIAVVFKQVFARPW